MALIVKNLTISIGKRDLLLDESVGIADGAKVGLLGRNGVGKTTFLKAILGQVDYNGEIQFHGKAAYFSQHIGLDPQKTVRETLSEKAHTHDQDASQKELEEIEQKMLDPVLHEKNPDQINRLTERYVELQQKIGAQHVPRDSGKIRSVLRTLDVDESWMEKKVGQLSTGQRAIVALAQVLSADADLLLLDEPTNHLDFKRLDILENHLRTFKGTVLIVTHDRYFLDRVCDTILKIENGKWMKYNGNYSAYKKTRTANFAAQKTAYEQETKYLAEEKDKIARLGKSPQKVKQGKYREKQLEKREAVERPDADQTRFHTHFDATPTVSRIILELKDLSIGYDKPLLSNINVHVGNDERVVLIGSNGIGKSTLFKTIEGRQKPLSGTVVLDSKAVLGYADQELADLDTDATLYEEIYKLLKDMAQTRRHLSMMGFVDDDEAHKPISSLSMGEKSRLNLLKILIGKPNLLLLDEPTNHMDIDAREIIENAFLNYDGAILAVSHDRYFIQRIAQRLLRVSSGTVQEMPLDALR